jgi:uncharacterized Zn-binding protein involved in type VI secretion
MSSVSVNPPHTPVTEGSGGKALATLPNVCKMPGPPAPFVPTPLPNLGTSGDSLTDATTTVKFEGKKVAIKGSHFKSQPSGDVASQGTGGGLISAKTQGKTEWLAPGSMDVKADGKNIQLLGDAMSNNGGSPANASTMKELQDALGGADEAKALCNSICHILHTDPGRGQSKKAENHFLDKKAGKDWQSQGNSFPVSGGGKCRPDLVNPSTNKIVEIKMMKGEALTENQEKFQRDARKGKQAPYGEMVIVTPDLCGCKGGKATAKFS